MANVPEIDKFTVLQYDEIVMIVEMTLHDYGELL